MNHSLAMRHLLWKDFRQLRPALVGCLLMLVCIQLLYLLAQLLEQGTGMSIVQNSFFIALIAPTLVAVACSGLSIGQERQTRSWNWSSSLPVSWSSALVSKIVVWLLASVVMTVLLLALYALLYRVAVILGRTPYPNTSLQTGEANVILAMMLLVPIEVFVVFSIAALLWNDTLLALVVAAIAVCVGHLFLVDFATSALHGFPENFYNRSKDYLATSIGLVVAANVFASIGLCYAFRWRWTSGQLSSLSLREAVRWRSEKRGGESSLAYASGYKSALAYAPWYKRPLAYASSHTLGGRVARPSESVVIFTQAWRSGLGSRLMIVISSLAVLALAPAGWRIYPAVIVLAALLLGSSAFGGEHLNDRYRFFADRGAPWLRFLIAHVSVAFLWLVGLLVVAHWLVNLQRSLNDFGAPNLVGLSLCAFGLAAFSSLCIANSVIATALAGLALLLGAMAYEVADSFWQALVGLRGRLYMSLPLTFAIMFAGALYQTRRWLRLDRPRSMPILVGSGVIGCLLPIWLCLTFGYLTVPATPWQGVPADQVNSGTQARLPQFKSGMPELMATMFPPTLSPSLSLAEERLAENYRDELQFIQERYGDLQQWLDRWQMPLEQLSAEIANSDAFVPASFHSLTTYANLIEETAVMAVVATKASDRETAVAAWRLNRSLLKLGETKVELATASVAPRTTTWQLWNLLTEQDLAFLEEGTDLKSLMPGQVDNMVWSQALRERWTVRRLGLQSDVLPEWQPIDPLYRTKGFRWLLQYYPPLRWAVERRMAQQLNQELYSLQGSPLTTLPNAYGIAAHDHLAVQIQWLRRFEERVTGKIASSH